MIPSRRPRRCRRGMLLQEAMMALAITVTILGIISRVTSLIARQREAAEQRALAVLELGNLMEGLRVQTWAEIAKPEFRPELSPACRQQLSDAKLEWRLDPASGPRELHRIQLTLDWRQTPDRRSPAVTLVAWRQPEKEMKP